MLRMTIALIACSMATGCDHYPRDIEGTLDHVRDQREFRVGLVASGNGSSHALLVGEYLGRVGRVTGAQPRITIGAAEPLLVKLEDGDLDLVVGQFATDSPWLTDVAVIEPLAQGQLRGRQVSLNPVARNGENRWIMLLEQQVRDMGAAK